MGFCDYVTLQNGCREYGVPQGSLLQTKSLYAGGGEFTITADGTLVEHLCRFEQAEGRPYYRRVPTGERVIDYHGDILLTHAADEQVSEFVARFTHGRLEWIRPLEDYPEANRGLLMEQGAR
jgi:hypothetical protein